jgi:hypothetical protein
LRASISACEPTHNCASNWRVFNFNCPNDK